MAALAPLPLPSSDEGEEGERLRRAIKTTMSPISAMYDMVRREWSIIISWRSVLRTRILSVETNSSTSVLG